MKKVKEMLIFLALLVVPLLLYFIVLGFTADVISNRPSFVGINNYIRMFLNDKTFGMALINAILAPAMVSFVSVSVFAVIVFFVRKKIKVPRWVFYLGSVFIGGMTALIYILCVNAALFGVPSDLYAAQTIVSHIFGYKPSVFDAITVPNVLISLYVGVFTAFVFWILELVPDIVKKVRKKFMVKNEENI